MEDIASIDGSQQVAPETASVMDGVLKSTLSPEPVVTPTESATPAPETLAPVPDQTQLALPAVTDLSMKPEVATFGGTSDAVVGVPGTDSHTALADPASSSQTPVIIVLPLDGTTGTTETTETAETGTATSPQTENVAAMPEVNASVTGPPALDAATSYAVPVDDLTSLLYPCSELSAEPAPTADIKPRKASVDDKSLPMSRAKETPVKSSAPVAKKPHTLLDLPVDILRLIIEEVGDTNDLITMARTCSTLYSLSIPRIYSRFDIVWPDSGPSDSDTKSVDALTYGLSTLCLGSAYARAAGRLRETMLRRGPGRGRARGKGPVDATKQFNSKPSFLGNDYAKYTRDFSLGNCPPNHIVTYNIHQEKGKMLGTLAALSIAKMSNLESFVWDTPSGVLSDVFMALGSLADFDPEYGKCRLERVWVRWHNNRYTSPTSSRASSRDTRRPSFGIPGTVWSPIGGWHPTNGTPRGAPLSSSESPVEFPTFSVVPPLKSLSVLDIDEVSYLDELSILIEKSYTRLEELRIGIAHHAVDDVFVQAWVDTGLKQVDLDAYGPEESTIGDRRLCGVIGILVGRIFDMSKVRRKAALGKNKEAEATAAATPTPAVDPEENPEAIAATDNATETADGGAGDTEGATFSMSDDASNESTPSGSGSSESRLVADAPMSSVEAERTSDDPGTEARASNETIGEDGEDCEDGDGEEEVRNKKLRLSTLELERVPLSLQAMARALDWSTITSLTILSCPHFDGLWRLLRKNFRPMPVATNSSWYQPSKRPGASMCTPPTVRLRYPLALKSIHTDNVRKPLLAFIKETLRPNSLEVLFLHYRPYAGLLAQPLEDIFRDAVKPHCASLQKLLINGDLQRDNKPEVFNRQRRCWDLTRDMIRFITSGRMRELRELSFSLVYRDWHMFLQALPNLVELRALHIQNISDHITGVYSRYESAMQVADIVTLRPEMRLVHLAIATRCYSFSEETRAGDGANGLGSNGTTTPRTGRSSRTSSNASDTASSSSDDDLSNDEDEGMNDTSDDGLQASAMDGMSDFTFYSGNDSGEAAVVDDDGMFAKASQGPQLCMNDIYFCDRVAIFKARHGKL